MRAHTLHLNEFPHRISCSKPTNFKLTITTNKSLEVQPRLHTSCSTYLRTIFIYILMAGVTYFLLHHKV